MRKYINGALRMKSQGSILQRNTTRTMQGPLQKGYLSVVVWVFLLSVFLVQTQDFGIVAGRNATITYNYGNLSVLFADWLKADNVISEYSYSEQDDFFPWKYIGNVDLDNDITTLVIINSVLSDLDVYRTEIYTTNDFFPHDFHLNYLVTESEIAEIHTLLCGDTYQDVGSQTFTTPCSTVNVVMPTGYNHSFIVEFSMDNEMTETLNDTDCDGSDPCMLSFSLPGDYILVHGSTFNVSVDLLLLSDPPVILTFQFTYEDWGPWQGKCPKCGGCGTQWRSASTSDGSVVYDTRQCPAKRCVNRMHSQREWVKPRRRWIIRARMCCYTWRWSPRNPSTVSIRDCRQRRVRGWVNPPWTD